MYARRSVFGSTLALYRLLHRDAEIRRAVGDEDAGGAERRDLLFGGRGTDLLNTRDLKGGDLANCGESRRDRDRAAIDRRDGVRGCELVRRRA